MASDSKKKSKSGSKSDSSSRSRSKDKSDSSSKKDKKDRSKSKDGNKSDSSSKKDKKDKKADATAEKAKPAPANLSASQEFEAGMLFSKFDAADTGLLDKAAFVQLYRSIGAAPPPSNPAGPPPVPPSFAAGQMFAKYASDTQGLSMSDFERFVADNANSKAVPASSVTWNDQNSGNMPPSFLAGQLYEKYADKGGGAMSKGDFERMVMATNMAGSTGSSLGDVNNTVSGLYSKYKLDKESGNVYERWPEPKTVEYTHYNETTGVPLTSDAATAHVATGQTVTTLEDSYGKRLSRLSALAAQNLAPRREQLSQVRHLILQRSDEIAAVAAAISKETMADLDGVLDRLKSAESLKQANLQQQLNEITAELSAVDRLVDKITAGSEAAASSAKLSEYKKVNNSGETLGMIGFIQIYPELSNAIERLVNRHINVKVEEVSDDLPREMMERNEVVRKTDKYEQALAVKDQMLWNMLKDKEEWDEKINEEREVNKEYATEMSEWLTLTNNMSEEINRIRDTHSVEMDRMKAENDKLRREVESMKEKLSILGGSGNF
jgi:hypothetical protein